MPTHSASEHIAALVIVETQRFKNLIKQHLAILETAQNLGIDCQSVALTFAHDVAHYAHTLIIQVVAARHVLNGFEQGILGAFKLAVNCRQHHVAQAIATSIVLEVGTIGYKVLMERFKPLEDFIS